jgi:hypothetical protein
MKTVEEQLTATARSIYERVTVVVEAMPVRVRETVLVGVQEQLDRMLRNFKDAMNDPDGGDWWKNGADDQDD